MLVFRRLRRFLALPLVALIVAISMPAGTAQAGLVGTDTVIDREAAQSDRARVMAFLERAEVRARIEALGIDAAEAASRVASLSDAEISNIAGKIDQLPAGQALGTILGAAVAIFVILLVTDILGLTDVYPFVHKHR